MARLHVATLLALLGMPATALLPCAHAIQGSSHAARSHIVMMGKKTAWSIGTTRKKAKKAKLAKPTAASIRGNTGTAVRGFGITKQKHVAMGLTFIVAVLAERARAVVHNELC